MFQLMEQIEVLKLAEYEFDVDKWKKENPKQVRALWCTVEKLVLQEYDTIKVLTMRNSYYHLLPLLNLLKEEEKICFEQYEYFQYNYEYYQSDKWPAWEKKHGLIRPTSKDPTIGVYNGDKQALAYVKESEFDFYRARGFIFIEKSGFIQDLEELSNYGWVILAGEGFASREIREQIAKQYSDKPILILHDFDYAGGNIRDVWEKGSKRTEHLDLTFDNIIDLGLTEEDVKELDLPRQPEVVQYQDKRKWRYELNALTVLVRRDNIKNPLLWYVVRRMKSLGIPICKEPLEEDFLMYVLMIDALNELFKPLFKKIIEENIINQGIGDETVQDVVFKDEFQQSGKFDFPSALIEKLHEVVKHLIKNTKTLYREDIEKEILKLAGVIN